MKKTVLWAAAALLLAADGWGQGLTARSLRNGSNLVVVAQPLSNATTCAWYPPDAPADAEARRVTSGGLTLVADLEAALADAEETGAAPAVVIAVGSASPDELARLLDRVLDGRPPRAPRPAATPTLTEGGVARRLGAAGADATLRMLLPLPPGSDPRRTDLEVLLSLLPGLVGQELPGLVVQVGDETAVLEAAVDAELAELGAGRLRLALARIAADPRLDPATVAVARRRLAVARAARLERHPTGAVELVRRARSSGLEGIRELLFGTSGVTVDRVRSAAAEWLPRHPGAVELVLPPRVFNPRFAPGPRLERLSGDATVAMLERPVATLSVLTVRPVVSADVDGELAATVLTRLAAEVRAHDGFGGTVEVRPAPATLELAAAADGFAELVEALAGGLATVASDTRAIVTDDRDSRRRALTLAARHLGLGDEVRPASLLRASNLALGAVVPDAEAADDALRKLLRLESNGLETAVGELSAQPRSRAAVSGERSTVVVELALDPSADETVTEVFRELLAERATTAFEDATSELLTPVVPGRKVVLLVVSGAATVPELEERIGRIWPQLVAEPAEEELAVVRRRVAAGLAAAISGATGRGRRLAGVAAGTAQWRGPAELEMAALQVDVETVTDQLAPNLELDSLRMVAAGVLPIPTVTPP